MIANDPNLNPALRSPRRLLTRRTMLGGAAAVALWAASPRAAQAVLSIDVTQGNPQPMPIALPDFVGGNPNDGDIGRNVIMGGGGNPAPVKAKRAARKR